MGYINNKKKNKKGFNSDEARPTNRTPRSYRDSDNNTLSNATCATCGTTCQVPFKPNGKKPVYCSDCFRKNSSPFSDGPPSRFSKDTDSNRRVFRTETRASITPLEQINEKLDRILERLE